MIRNLILALTLTLAGSLAAADRSTVFVNQKVSAQTIALNEALRIEFTTTPKQIEAVDPARAIDNALALASGGRWVLHGRPTVVQDEKTKTLRCAFVLLPRESGSLALPAVPLTWLAGDQVAEFGSVTVEAKLVVGAERRDAPSIVQGVAGFAWGTARDEVLRITGKDTLQEQDGAATLRPRPDLELVLRGGRLAEAAVTSAGVKVADARASLLQRYGSPLDESQGLTWVIGWTRITASDVDTGMRLRFVREDLVAKAVQASLDSRIFDLLDKPLTMAGTATGTPAK